MGLTLHLGVIDVPYANPPRKRGGKAKSGTQSTGDVAGWLEDRYHIMAHFFEMHGSDIAASLESSIAGSLETMMQGGPQELTFGSGEGKIDQMFREFLTKKEMDSLGYPGVPTAASLAGRSSRFKGKRGPVRPSFVDTALYENSFKSWID